MAGEQKRRKRQAWIAAALLLGYQFKKSPTGQDGLELWNGTACAMEEDIKDIYGTARNKVVRRKFSWQLAVLALEHEGIDPNAIWEPDAANQNQRARSSIFERRADAGRTKRLVKSHRRKSR